MTITTQDIKFFASKVMSDVPEGGGGPSAVVLQSGKSNNIFRDVREQDRAGGNLSMRQVHLGITSGNTDVAMGSNIIVSEPPSDPTVSVVLMATRDDFATRQQDIARLEELTDGITLPRAACNTWRALYAGLKTFREDLMQHIHTENNILFERFAPVAVH